MPARLKMEGMVHKANRVLDHAAKTDRKGVLKRLFQKAKGIILISVVETGLVLSAGAGVGIMMVKNQETEEWSPPCACGMASTSWGFSLGAVKKDVIIFALDDKSVQAFTSQLGLKLGVAGSVTLGTMGLNAGANVNVSGSGTQGSLNVHNVGLGGTVSIAFCQGAYVSASVSGAFVAPNVIVNRSFYDDAKLSAKDILFGDTVDVPHDKFSPELQAIYGKLFLLSQGCNNYCPEFDDDVGDTLPQAVPAALDSVVAEASIKAIVADEVDETARHCEVVIAKPCRTEDENLALPANAKFRPFTHMFFRQSILMPTS